MLNDQIRETFYRIRARAKNRTLIAYIFEDFKCNIARLFFLLQLCTSAYFLFSVLCNSVEVGSKLLLVDEGVEWPDINSFVTAS